MVSKVKVIEKRYEGLAKISMGMDRIIFTPRRRGSAFTIPVNLFDYEFEHESGRPLKKDEILKATNLPVRKIPRHLFYADKLAGGNIGLYEVNSGILMKMVSFAEFEEYYEVYTGEARDEFSGPEEVKKATPRNPWLKEESIVSLNVGNEDKANESMAKLRLLVGVTGVNDKRMTVTGFVEMHRNRDGEVEYKYNGEPVIIKKWEDRYKTMRGFCKAFHSAMLNNDYLRDGRIKVLKMYGSDMDMGFRFDVSFITKEV